MDEEAPGGGYRMTPYKLVFETGWNRFDRNDSVETYDLPNNYLHTFYAGVGIEGKRPMPNAANTTDL